MDHPLGVAARAVIQRSDGWILLVRRSSRSSTDPGRWELPGGKMAFGERLVDALTREVQEETGLSVRPGNVVDIDHRLVGPFWVTTVVFDGGTVDRTVIISSEHSAYSWVDPHDVGELDLGRGTARHVAAWLAHNTGKETDRG